MSNQEYWKIQTTILKVNIHCESCKRKVKKILHEIEGVYITKFEINSKKVTVLGNVDPETLIKALVKKGKRAELWDAQTLNNMTTNLHIENGNASGKKGNHGNQLKGKGHSQSSDLTPQQKLQLQLRQQQQKMTKLPSFKDPKLFIPMPIIKNQMKNLQKDVKCIIPVEEDEDETTDDDDEDEDDEEDTDDEDDFPKKLPFNKMNANKPMKMGTGQGERQKNMMMANGMLNSQYGQTGNGMQNQASNYGGWSNGNFTMTPAYPGNGSQRVQNLGNGYPQNMSHTSHRSLLIEGPQTLAMYGNNPYYRQQQLTVGMMNQQTSIGNERFQPMMYTQPPSVNNYMSQPYPYTYPQPMMYTQPPSVNNYMSQPYP